MKREEHVFAPGIAMVIRPRNQRRRRVVIDEVASSTATQEETPKPRRRKKKAEEKEARAYSYGANRRNQLKTTDLIPKRFLAFSLVVCGLLASIGLLNFLASMAPAWSSMLGESTQVLALSGTGTISNWFVSFLLIISAIASLQIYGLRQHRCDDYRGTYRLWLWLSALFLLASMSCVVDLRTLATNCFESVFEVQLSQSFWTILLIKLALLTALVGRAIFEIRGSMGTVAIVLVGWLAYLGAMAMKVPSIQEAVVVDHETCFGNLFLFGTCSILVAHFFYARFVYLMAHGLIKPMTMAERAAAKRATKEARVKTKEEALAAKAQAKADAAQEKADKIQAAKDAVAQDKADKIAAKESAAAEKLAAKENAIAEKQAAKEAAIAEKRAAKDAVLDAKHAAATAKVSERQAKKQAALDAKAAAKAKKLADAQAKKQAKLAKQQTNAAAAETGASATSTNSQSAAGSRTASATRVTKTTRTKTAASSKARSTSGPLASRIKSGSNAQTQSSQSNQPARSSDKAQDEIEAEILKLSEKSQSLSKSEQRRLRKLEKRQRRAA